MDDVPRSLRDAAYVLVGFGVIGFQRAQVARRDLVRQLPDLVERLPPAARETIDTITSALRAEPPPRPQS